MRRISVSAALVLALGLSGCVSTRTARRMYRDGYARGASDQAETAVAAIKAYKAACDERLEEIVRWRKAVHRAMRNAQKNGGS